MISIEELKDDRQVDAKPYQKGVRVNVIQCSSKTYYRNAKNENKVLYHMSLADETGCIKSTCYNEEYYHQTKEQNGLMIRNYIVKDGIILITKKTKIARMPPLSISQSLIQEAQYILNPMAPPLSPIKAVREAAVKTLLSVSGTVTEIEDTRTIIAKGQETKIRSITIKDATDSVKISLWREATDFIFHLGTYVQLTHMTVHEFNREKILNTTRHTTIQVVQPPKETIFVTLYGVEKKLQENTTMTAQVGTNETLQSIDIVNIALMDYLRIEPDTENFEDSLMAYLPIKLKVLFCNGCITDVLEEI
ncbi:uncharacterized protein LOC144784991 [Lissotriton helveticus]